MLSRFRRRSTKDSSPVRDDRAGRVADLREIIKQGDPDQITFQIEEIAGEQFYLRKGIQLSAGAVILDVGGNIGVSAAYFATQCGASEVFSFEPVPTTFELLQSNLASLDACIPIPLGLAESAGAREVTVFTGGDSVLSGLDVDSATYRNYLKTVAENLGATPEEALRITRDRCQPELVECSFTTVSDFLRERAIDRVDLLKVDVEGAETSVLAGVNESDWPKIQQVVTEVHSGEALSLIEDLLTGHSFKVTVEQDPKLAGTPIRLLYAVR